MKTLYKVRFINEGCVYEVYVRSVYQADIHGFVVIEGFVFGEKNTLVVDPSEEQLKNEFSKVKRCIIPMHSVIRIDEVEKRGVAKVSELPKGSNVMPFPSTVYTPER